MNYAKLRGRIRELYNSEKNFAESIGKTQNWLSKILNGKKEIKRSEIELFISKLNIDEAEINIYFFD